MDIFTGSLLEHGVRAIWSWRNWLHRSWRGSSFICHMPVFYFDYGFVPFTLSLYVNSLSCWLQLLLIWTQWMAKAVSHCWPSVRALLMSVLGNLFRDNIIFWGPFRIGSSASNIIIAKMFLVANLFIKWYSRDWLRKPVLTFEKLKSDFFFLFMVKSSTISNWPYIGKPFTLITDELKACFTVE